MRQNRYMTDQHDAAADPLQKSGGNQHSHILCQTTNQRCHTEHYNTDQKDPLAAKPVSKRPCCHQDRGASQRIGGHDPLQLIETAVQNLLQD